MTCLYSNNRLFARLNLTAGFIADVHAIIIGLYSVLIAKFIKAETIAALSRLVRGRISLQRALVCSFNNIRSLLP
jgi:hypothetical protein